MHSTIYQTHKKMYYCALSLSLAGIIALCLYHYFDYDFYGIKDPCFFKAFLHIYCPGCGGTRAVDAFLHGNFVQSFLYHPVIVYVFAMFLMYFIPATYTFLINRDGKLHYKFHMATLWGLLAVVVGHFIVRNVLLLCFGIDYLHDFIS